jgi:hypothetical protein
MNSFIKLFIIVLILIGIPLAVLAIINPLRKKQPGCSGNHDCVTYKGEKIKCPSCELREHQAAQKDTQNDT